MIVFFNNKEKMGNDEYQSRYKESYSGQEPDHKDGYGNNIYTTYIQQYAYQNATGRDAYGNPTYDREEDDDDKDKYKYWFWSSRLRIY